MLTTSSLAVWYDPANLQRELPDVPNPVMVTRVLRLVIRESLATSHERPRRSVMIPC
jgi:hypothetical protein